MARKLLNLSSSSFAKDFPMPIGVDDFSTPSMVDTIEVCHENSVVMVEVDVVGEIDVGLRFGSYSSIVPCTQLVECGEVVIDGGIYECSESDKDSVPFPFCSLHPTLD